jgi:hypothetical protein
MRSFWAKCLVGTLSVGAWASFANAQNNRDVVASGKKAGGPGIANAQNNRDVVVQDNKAEAMEVAAESIVAREEAASGRAFDPGFRAEVLRKLASRTPSDLESIQAQSGAGLGLLPPNFGSSQADLVYTPVTPCRILDTRVVGGPIVPGTNRSFDVAGSNLSFQGGNSSGCGVPSGPATAAVINLVAVNAQGNGDLRITPYGTPIPFASIINYGVLPTNAIANGPAVTICNPATTTCTYDFTIQADTSATELVADVQGYFSLLPTTLASGRTLTGNYAVTLVAAVANDFMATNIQFPFPLASAPSAPPANFIPAGGSATTNCPGSATNPQALPGNLCVYEGSGGNRTFIIFFRTSTGFSGTDVFGSGMDFSSGAAGRTFSYGTWAVTAP